MSFAAKLLTINLVLVAITRVQLKSSGRKIYAYFNSMECPHYNAHYIETFRCWLEADPQSNDYMMNAEMMPKQDLNSIKLQFVFVVEQNVRNITYLSVDIDICESLGAAFSNPILRLMADEIHRKGNLPLECPLKKGFLYAIHNFTINTKQIPPFVPRMRWIADSNYYTKTNTTLIHVIVGGRVDHTKPKKVTKA